MKTNIRDFFPTRSLGRDLLFGLIPLIVIVATVVGTVNYWINTRREINILNEQAIEATENLARILAYSIYKTVSSLYHLSVHFPLNRQNLPFICCNIVTHNICSSKYETGLQCGVLINKI